ncbi:hypothetical protein [Vibrio penaeicida]|uniref:hypothetical protein n=1 Tax=Vibrio penaeicida TaxID=104609 RepID=UPI000CE9DD53|nr:hypothetical protein [Vibrio penaeicida]
MSITLKWNKEKPSTPGIYFTAIKLGEGLGRYDFLLWSGDVWETDQKVEVIAYVDADEIKRVLSPNWPEDVEVCLPTPSHQSSDDDLWVED